MSDENETKQEVQSPKRQLVPVKSNVAIFDTHQLDHMIRVAKAMADSSMLPDTLTMVKPKGQSDAVPLAYEQVYANCLIIVEQGWRWDISPFLLMDHVSFIYGKRLWSGELMIALIEAKCGPVDFEFFGAENTDDYGVIVKAPRLLDGKESIEKGTVGEWGTRTVKGLNDQWKGGNRQRRMLRYRGAREWIRFNAASLGLGFPDNAPLREDIEDEFRANGATDITPKAPLSERLAAKALEHSPGMTMPDLPPEKEKEPVVARGFDNGHVQAEVEKAATKGRGRPRKEKEQQSGGAETVSQAVEKEGDGPLERAEPETETSTPESQEAPAAASPPTDQNEGADPEISDADVADEAKSSKSPADGDADASSVSATREATPEDKQWVRLNFAQMCWGAANEAGLQKKVAQFWIDKGPNGDVFPDDDPRMGLCRKIYAIHLRRVKNELDISGTTTETAAAFA